MAGEYRYMFGNWQRARIDTEIPLYGVYIRGVLNDIGYMQGSFQLDQSSKTGKSNTELIEATTPFRNFVVVVRDGRAIWGGYITSRTYQSQSKSIQLYAKAFEGYPDERIIPVPELDPGGSGHTFGSADQGDLFVNLMNGFSFDEAVAGPLFPLFFDAEDDSNVPVDPVFGTPVTGINKEYDVFRYDYKTYRQIIDELANTDDGFDWRIIPQLVVSDVVLSDIPGAVFDEEEAIQVHKRIKFGYPTLGAEATHDSYIFEYPGNILNYYRTDNLAGAGTTVIGIGSGQGEAMLVKEIANNDLTLTVGGFFPRDVVIPLKHIDTQATLDARVEQENVKRRPPKITYKVSVRPDKDPVFGLYDLGSKATLIITDAMHPDTTRVPVTVNEYALRPPSQDGGAEEIDLGFAGDFE